MHQSWTTDAETYAVEAFARNRYLVVRHLLPPESIRLLHAYYGILVASGRFERGDGQCPASLSLYGDPALDALLQVHGPVIGRIVGLELVPTYSYTRIYAPGEVLDRHRDRPSCEISATVTIRVPAGGPPSAIHMKPPEGQAARLEMAEGDACIYAGCEVEHWRDAIPRDGYIQLFLHYVTRHGSNFPTHARDGRPFLGCPREKP